MPATRNPKNTYHALTGDEMRTVLLQKTRAGIDQAMDLRVFRSYPLVKYRITLELIPYRDQGEGAPVPDTAQRCTINGEQFIDVIEDAVILEDASKIIGFEVDPQTIREECGMGRVETVRTGEGHFDIRQAPRTPEADRRPTVPEPRTPIQKPKALEPEIQEPELPAMSDEDIARKTQEDVAAWSSVSPDTEFRRGIADEEPVPGRVTVVGKTGRRGR